MNIPLSDRAKVNEKRMPITYDCFHCAARSIQPTCVRRRQ